MNPGERLEHGLRLLGLPLSSTARQSLLDYAALLMKWNRTYRLTGFGTIDAVIAYHVLDSLAILPYVRGATLLDVGSGGGVPGVPIAIARPDLQVVLLDSNSKKAAFLRQAAIELGLSHIDVHCGRVEAYRSATGFATVTARAFSSLLAFVACSRHLLSGDGCWLAMRGASPHGDDLARLPGEVVVEAVHRLQVPGVEAARHVVVMSLGAAAAFEE